MQFLYATVAWLISPFYFAFLWWKQRHSADYRRRSVEHFTWWRQPLPRGVIWLHAASLGEAKIAESFLTLFRRYSQQPVIVTTNTPTGAAHINALALPEIYQVYTPFDCPALVARFIRRTQPTMLIVVERELWPMMLTQCHRFGIPTALINARLSQRSLQHYQHVASFVKPLLANFTFIAVQNEADCERLIKLGANPNACLITGNIKFDLDVNVAPAAATALREHWGTHRQIVVAGSTHHGEEQILLDLYAALKPEFPNLLFVIVPRHPQRFRDVLQLAQHADFTTLSHASGKAADQATDIIIGDTMGELPLFYAAADITFVGGSLVPIGGHNILEPAALAKLVLTGSHCFNFTDICNLLVNENALTICHDAIELQHHIRLLLQNPATAITRGQQAFHVVQQHRGALQKHLPIIEFAITRQTPEVNYAMG